MHDLYVTFSSVSTVRAGVGSSFGSICRPSRPLTSWASEEPRPTNCLLVWAEVHERARSHLLPHRRSCSSQRLPRLFGRVRRMVPPPAYGASADERRLRAHFLHEPAVVADHCEVLSLQLVGVLLPLHPAAARIQVRGFAVLLLHEVHKLMQQNRAVDQVDFRP